MASYVNCHYFGCDVNNKTHSERRMFYFPVSDKKRCCDWIASSGRDDFIELPDKILKNKRICSKHFDAKQFTNELRNKLNKNAVPVPYYKQETPLNAPTPSTPATPLTADTPLTTLAPLTSDIHQTDTSGSRSTEFITQSPPVKHGNDNESLQDFLSDFLPIQSIVHNEEITPRKKKLKKHIEVQKRRINKQTLLITSKRKRISKLKKTQTFTHDNILHILSQHVSGDVLIFMKMQMFHRKRTQWTKEEKNFSISFYYKSPSTYSFFISRGFKLPCVRSVQKWISLIKLESGFSDEVFQKLAMKVKSMTEHEKDCILMWDEMSIKKSLQYDPKQDLIEGFQDLGYLGRESCIATHALLFMVRGLKFRWKLPIAFTLSENATTGDVLAILVDVCLEKVFETGLKVRGVVCDQGSTNSSAFKTLGATTTDPHFFFNTNKIYCIFDAPHLIKSIRNTLLNCDLDIGGQLVKWSDIVEFYDLDSRSPNDCRSAPKLTQRHLSPHQFHRMKVNLATQVLSFSVSRGMKAASALGQLKSETALNTATFLGTCNDITDCLNSRSEVDKCPLRRPLSERNPQVEKCLVESVQKIKSWKLNKFKTNKKGEVTRVRAPPCFSGLSSTITATLALYRDLEAEGNHFLLTSRLNQDPLENMFGVIRQRGGYNANPTASQFRRNLQHAINIRLMTPPDSSNCEPDDDATLDLPQEPSDFQNDNSPSLHPNEELHSSIHQSYENFTAYISDDIPYTYPQSSNIFLLPTPHHSGAVLREHQSTADNSLETFHITSHLHNINGPVKLEDTVINYIAGWAAKKCVDQFACDRCIYTLIKGKEELVETEEALIYFKQFNVLSCKGLKRPTALLYSVIKATTSSFSLHFTKLKTEKNVKKQVVIAVKKDIEARFPEWFNSECDKHRQFLLEQYVKMKIFYTLKWESQSLRDCALISNKRRKNCNENEKPNAKLMKLKSV